MSECVSIAIETSCRRGGVALGVGDELVEAGDFPSGRRHAVQLVARLAEMLAGRNLKPADLSHVYVSAGPGSFTGLRVGLTVARTLAQLLPSLQCIAVPTVGVVAENTAGLEGTNFGVVMDAKDDTIYAAVFTRRDGRTLPAGPPKLETTQQFLASAPRPITLLGEGLGYHDLAGEGVTIAEKSLWLPTVRGLWAVGRRLAAEGLFTPPSGLRPLYLRKPEAVRLWELRHGQAQSDTKSNP